MADILNEGIKGGCGAFGGPLLESGDFELEPVEELIIFEQFFSDLVDGQVFHV